MLLQGGVERGQAKTDEMDLECRCMMASPSCSSMTVNPARFDPRLCGLVLVFSKCEIEFLIFLGCSDSYMQLGLGCLTSDRGS